VVCVDGPYPQYGVRTRTAADILVVRCEDFIRRVRKDLLASIRHRSRLKLEWRKQRAIAVLIRLCLL
jgi:hypothetical protein